MKVKTNLDVVTVAIAGEDVGVGGGLALGTQDRTGTGAADIHSSEVRSASVTVAREPTRGDIGVKAVPGNDDAAGERHVGFIKLQQRR